MRRETHERFPPSLESSHESPWHDYNSAYPPAASRRTGIHAEDMFNVRYTGTGMAFTVEDLNDLLTILRQHPEWRDAVRREVLTQELLDLPEVVRGLADIQTVLSRNVDELS